MKKQNVIILGVLGFIAAVYYLLQFSNAPTPARLASRAISATDPSARISAMVDLSMLGDPAAVAQIERVVKESKDPEVLALSLTSFADRANDRSSLPVFLSYLDHESAQVRAPAFKGVMRLAGISPDDTAFQPDAPPAVRGPALVKLRDDVRELQVVWSTPRRGPRGSAEMNPEVTPTSTPIERPATKIKDEKSKELPKEPSKEAPTAPTPSWVPGPQSPPTPTITTPPYDDRGVQLLAWALRGLGLVAILAELVAAFRAFVGDSASDKKGKRNTPTQPTKEVAEQKALPAAGVGPRLTRLFNAFVYGVTLMVAAEMILLAVRVEQKMDCTSRAR